MDKDVRIDIKTIDNGYVVNFYIIDDGGLSVSIDRFVKTPEEVFSILTTNWKY